MVAEGAWHSAPFHTPFRGEVAKGHLYRSGSYSGMLCELSHCCRFADVE